VAATGIKKDILATLTYFNMFDYPLKKREIYAFLGSKPGVEEFETALYGLLHESAVFKIGNYYSLFNNYALAERRSTGNKKAAAMLKTAARSAGLVARFPFVKAVAISGSLSKRFADEKADIDLFIITSTDRLWLARTFLHLFKKITFLFNLQDRFCMNYFIDESCLCILEKNIYTAVEVATIMPLHGSTVFELFYAANQWTKEYLPNNYMHVAPPAPRGSVWISRLAEKLLDNRAGDALDNFLMRLTAGSWERKTLKRKTNSKGILLGMHTGKHFSKPNPANFQQKLLLRYANCLKEVLGQYDLSEPVRNNSL
jgi:hypothetical protein